MKKFLAILLAVMLLLTFAGCNRDKDTGVNQATPEAFVKPENYVTVLKVTINPEFNLYLDKDGVVLAVEPVNADAKSVAQDITTTGDIKTVMETIVSATNKGGFVKENAKVDIKVTEVKDTAVSPMEVLNTAKETADDSFKKIDATVTVSSSVADNVVFVTADPTPETTTQAPTQEPTQAPTQEPTKAPTPKPTPKPTEAPSYTSIASKKGVWLVNFVNKNGEMIKAELSLSAEEQGVTGDVGDPLSKFPDNVKEDIKPDCELIDGEYYYFGRGDGCPFSSVTENGNKVTVLDEDSKSLVLERIGENALKVVSIESGFGVLDGLKTGTQITYKA